MVDASCSTGTRSWFLRGLPWFLRVWIAVRSAWPIERLLSLQMFVTGLSCVDSTVELSLVKLRIGYLCLLPVGKLGALRLCPPLAVCAETYLGNDPS